MSIGEKKTILENELIRIKNEITISKLIYRYHGSDCYEDLFRDNIPRLEEIRSGIELSIYEIKGCNDTTDEDTSVDGYGYGDTTDDESFGEDDNTTNYIRLGAECIKTNHEEEGAGDSSAGFIRGGVRPRGVCFAFQKGECERGETCRFSHEAAESSGDYPSY